MPSPGASALMPPLLYGTAWKKDRTAALVEQALGLGFRGIDTACQPKHYDEPGVGAGVSAAFARGLTREALYLQTKFTPLSGQDPARVPYDTKADLAAQIQQSAAASLENLRTPYLDCLLLHSPLPTLRETLDAWRALEALVERGVTLGIGISNCYAPKTLLALCHDTRVKPRVVQNRFYEKTGYDSELRQICDDQGIVYQSFWTLTANPRVLENARLRAIARRHQATPEQTFFRCLTQRRIVPLTGTTSRAHMVEDLDLLRFELAEDEVDGIFALLTAAR